jgi:hypothetical protein
MNSYMIQSLAAVRVSEMRTQAAAARRARLARRARRTRGAVRHPAI